ncbi:MAG: SDR family NAD(P)-dependent oxidoreductase [Corynebacterium sp.]|nr:SDR family NAD(P)-dependent oxidoreductase [Corynebacterium sp.]
MPIDANELEICLKVIKHAETLSENDPQSVQLQHAVSSLFKVIKKKRKAKAKAARQTHDAAVLQSTATANPHRIDDETAGLLITPANNALEPGQVATPHGFAGELRRPHNCYVCKQPYTLIDSFHHQLCPTCAADNKQRRQASVDLTGRRALLTGGRAKIGMYIALKLLRDGADLTITTRFPKDAIRRFSAVEDSHEWLHRLHVVGIDLRDPAQVVELADRIATAPLDILINNAAQTVRRSPGAYSGLIDAEAAPLDGIEHDVHYVALGNAFEPKALTGTSKRALAQVHAARLAALAMTGGSASLERVADGTAIDAGGLIPDQVSHNSWVAKIGEIDPVELLEVQLCNSIAPFILINRLRPALEASPARRKYIVNVSAMEGVFGRGYKGPGHPHTNMAKAALNMLTRTSAGELFKHGILMTAVDTGWITDERPHTTKERLAKAGFHAPLDLVDGATRVYDPIVQGEHGVDLYGCFLKDYKPSQW